VSGSGYCTAPALERERERERVCVCSVLGSVRDLGTKEEVMGKHTHFACDRLDRWAGPLRLRGLVE
jgi:hypothetical protein